MNPEINTFQQATCTFHLVVEHLTTLREPSRSRHHLQNTSKLSIIKTKPFLMSKVNDP